MAGEAVAQQELMPSAFRELRGAELAAAAQVGPRAIHCL